VADIPAMVTAWAARLSATAEGSRPAARVTVPRPAEAPVVPGAGSAGPVVPAAGSA
jgi:hypothetical protein